VVVKPCPLRPEVSRSHPESVWLLTHVNVLLRCGDDMAVAGSTRQQVSRHMWREGPTCHSQCTNAALMKGLAQYILEHSPEGLLHLTAELPCRKCSAGSTHLAVCPPSGAPPQAGMSRRQ